MKITPPDIRIRPLTGNDSAAYRALRQRILALGDGRCFSDSYIREKQLKTEHAWREWCTERPDHCIFGTFDKTALIGVMMVTQYDSVGDDTVEWEAVWLEPRYRRVGIAKLAYQMAQQWTELRGYRRVVGFIRTDNQRARDIFERLGGRYISTKHDEVWADGSIGDVHTFMLDLQPAALHARQRQTLRHLSEARLLADEQHRLPDHVAHAVGAS
jgi:RimJ/RimL family protein N-acetyltransferase